MFDCFEFGLCGCKAVTFGGEFKRLGKTERVDFEMEAGDDERDNDRDIECEGGTFLLDGSDNLLFADKDEGILTEDFLNDNVEEGICCS
jgi:hypothetical protein